MQNVLYCIAMFHSIAYTQMCVRCALFFAQELCMMKGLFFMHYAQFAHAQCECVCGLCV